MMSAGAKRGGHRLEFRLWRRRVGGGGVDGTPARTATIASNDLAGFMKICRRHESDRFRPMPAAVGVVAQIADHSRVRFLRRRTAQPTNNQVITA